MRPDNSAPLHRSASHSPLALTSAPRLADGARRVMAQSRWVPGKYANRHPNASPNFDGFMELSFSRKEIIFGKFQLKMFPARGSGSNTHRCSRGLSRSGRITFAGRVCFFSLKQSGNFVCGNRFSKQITLSASTTQFLK